MQNIDNEPTQEELDEEAADYDERVAPNLPPAERFHHFEQRREQLLRREAAESEKEGK